MRSLLAAFALLTAAACSPDPTRPIVVSIDPAYLARAERAAATWNAEGAHIAVVSNAPCDPAHLEQCAERREGERWAVVRVSKGFRDEYGAAYCEHPKRYTAGMTLYQEQKIYWGTCGGTVHLAHEFGHMLGLDHDAAKVGVMRPVNRNGAPLTLSEDTRHEFHLNARR